MNDTGTVVDLKARKQRKPVSQRIGPPPPLTRPVWSDEEMAATVDAFRMAVYWLRDVFADGQPRRATDVVNAWLTIGDSYATISAARSALGIDSVAAKGGRVWVVSP